MAIPWGAIASFLLNHPELGWVLLAAWLFIELRTERGVIYKLDKKITSSIIVIRALAKKEDAIDEEKVDEYLVENGMAPEDFFTNIESENLEESPDNGNEPPLIGDD